MQDKPQVAGVIRSAQWVLRSAVLAVAGLLLALAFRHNPHHQAGILFDDRVRIAAALFLIFGAALMVSGWLDYRARGHQAAAREKTARRPGERSAERVLWAATGTSLGLLLFAWVMLRSHRDPRSEIDALDGLRYAAGLVACIGIGWLPFAWAGRRLEAAWAERGARRQARITEKGNHLYNQFQHFGPGASSPSGDRRQMAELAEQVQALAENQQRLAESNQRLAAETRGNGLQVKGLVGTFANLLPEYGHPVEELQETSPMPKLRAVPPLSDENRDTA